nr:pyridoxamine 5'-phosphate oxidase family protein [Chlorobium ferrooxidans]
MQHNGGKVMIPEKLTEILKHDGVVAIATLGQNGPHMVNTWNSYVRITDAERILIPVGYMQLTEANIAFNNQVLITLGSRKVAGNMGPGAGFLIKGTASIETSGADFDVIKAKFAWARAVMAVTASSIEQTL